MGQQDPEETAVPVKQNMAAKTEPVFCLYIYRQKAGFMLPWRRA